MVGYRDGTKIRVHAEKLGNQKWQYFSLTVATSVCSHHAYMDQWEAEIDTALFFECKLGEYYIR